MKNALQITPAEFQIMEVLWRRPEAQSVGDVLGELRQRRDLAYTTVMTLLDKLARKGSVSRLRQGKAYLYRPAVEKDKVLDWLIQEFADDYCGGERARLVRAARESPVGARAPSPKPTAPLNRPSSPTSPQPDPDLDVVLL